MCLKDEIEIRIGFFMGGYRVCAASSYLSRQTYGIKEMEKRLKILGIIDAEGYELDNRVYSGGGISPCMTTGNAKKNVVRKYTLKELKTEYEVSERVKTANNSNRSDG